VRTWVILAFFLIGGAMLLALVIVPWIVRIGLYYKNYVHHDASIKGNLRMLAAARKLDDTNRQADLYRDPQVDDMLSAGELDAALELVRERMRLAYERGLDERVAFYETYELNITEQQTRG
jgi:hypothetical protein